MTKKVRKAVIAAAGYGTRFLPATKAQPKEMLPLVDKPIIQYVVEDLVSAGIEEIIIVTGWHKRTIEDHFDYPYELERRLEQSGKFEALEQIRRISDMANFVYIRQKGPMGNATPIWNARHLIGDEPFLYFFGDDFIEATPTRAQQLVAAYQELGGSAILGSIKATKEEDYRRYGIAAGEEINDHTLKVHKVIEKPGIGVVDSDYAIVSGYLFSHDIISALEEAMKRQDVDSTPRELVYIDAVNILLEQEKDCYAVQIQNGTYYDCGNKLEYLKAVVEFGLKHEELRKDFGEYLKHLKV